MMAVRSSQRSDDRSRDRSAKRRLKPSSTSRVRATMLDESLAGAKPKSERSRDLILQSAAQSFRRQGFSATTLRQIDAKARMKASSICYHSDSTEQIREEVLDRGGLGHVFQTVRNAVDRAGKVSTVAGSASRSKPPYRPARDERFHFRQHPHLRSTAGIPKEATPAPAPSMGINSS